MNDKYNQAKLIAASIPPMPPNDRSNKNWRAVRKWAETHSKEIMRVYDIVDSKTITMKLLGLRSMGPFHTACLKEGRLELVPQSRRSRSKVEALPQDADSAGLKRQMAGLTLELKRTRKVVDGLRRKLESVGVDLPPQKRAD